METHLPSADIRNVVSFKSYYVVWKLHFKLVVKKLPSLFKSYYVVWKPVANTFVMSSDVLV